MPRTPRTVEPRNEQQDDVATMMAMLLPVHSAMTVEWLADAAATAAERTIAATHTFLYIEEESGALGWRTPTSDLRRRSLQRAVDAVGPGVLDRALDPASPVLEQALESDHPLNLPARSAISALTGKEHAESTLLGADSISFAPLFAAGERLGLMILLLAGSPEAERVRLFADHVACALVNLRQAVAAKTTTGAEDVVRTLFDARKASAELEREIMRAERFKRDVSICVIEATNLRLLRERFGPDLTRELLDRTGEVLAAHSRDIDVIGDYKESGYTMVLSETSAEGVRQASRRLLSAATEAGRESNIPGLELHLACGWATCPLDGKTTTALFAAAERRMYDPKTQVA